MEDNTFTIDTEIKTDGIEKGTKDVSKSLTKMAGTIAMAGAKSALAFTAILKILPLLVKSASKGFKDLAKFDEDFNKSMSSIMNSSRYLQGSLATAFGGLVEAIEPIVITVLDSLAEMFNRFAEIVAYLNGRDTFSKAIKQQEDYAKAVDKTAGKLASFDKLNVIGQKKNGLAFTTEDVKVSDEVKKRYESLKKTLEEIKKLFKGGGLTDFDAGNAGEFITEAIVKGVDLVDGIVKAIDTATLGRKLGETIGSIDIGEIIVKILSVIPDIADSAYEFVKNFIQGWFETNPWTCSIAIALGIGKLISAFSGTAFLTRVWDALSTKVPALTSTGALVGKLALGLGVAWLFGKITDDFQEANIDNEWVNTLIDVLEKAVQGVIIGASLDPALAGAGLILGITIGIALHWDKINAGLSEFEDKANKAMDSVVDKFESVVKKVTKNESFEIPTPKVPKAFGSNGTISSAFEDAFTFKSLRQEKYPFENVNNAMKKAGDGLAKVLQDTWDDTKLNILNPLYFSITGKKLPGLATGAVIPPNAPFTAVLGDNKRETEIVSPLSTMKQALAEALAEYGGDTRVVLELDGETIYNSVVKRNRKNTARTGVNYMM